ncbi:MAG: Cys-tRNA(Pro) deacylase [Ignavibacteriaceae bacterium]|nr:Cys-tRNA(Pro) deacylase [Ignavibacteriaceae bacterium]
MSINKQKTNVMRLLESQGKDFCSHFYEVNEEELDAVSVAKKISADPDTVFKTLVLRTDENKIIVCVIPGPYELELKKTAKVANCKNVAPVKVKELLDLTGYIRGGCSPLGMKKKYPVFIDETALLFDKIYFSAGVRGIQIGLPPTELAELSEATISDLI